MTRQTEVPTYCTGERQALWWVHRPPGDGETAIAEAYEWGGQLADQPRWSGWAFVVRDEPEQRRVTIIGTAPRA